VIELSKITEEGLRLSGRADLIQLEGNDALRGLSWNIFIQPAAGDFFFDIRAEAVYEGICCRCLEPIDVTARVLSQFLGSPDPALAARGSHTLGTQDLDVIYLPEEILDEAALLKEQFVLQRPMQLLCKEGCLGLCYKCGKNWNKGRCQCIQEIAPAPGTLARALADIKLDVGP
jgi:uncharacterized protein